MCFSRLSLFFPLSSLHKRTKRTGLFVQQKHVVFRQNRLHRSLITKSGRSFCCLRRKNQTFRGTLNFGAHLFFFVFFLSFFLSFFSSVVSFSRERGKEREDISSFPCARAQKRSEEHRRERFVFNAKMSSSEQKWEQNEAPLLGEEEEREQQRQHRESMEETTQHLSLIHISEPTRPY